MSNQNYPDMAKKRLTPQDRIALDNWNELVASVREHSDINPTDTETEIRQRRERLEKNDEEWFKYYFAMYCTCESAAFHKKATGRLMRNNRWYEVRAWSRELAKSARSMMEISKLALTKKIRNVLLISNSADNAERLLLPFMANFGGEPADHTGLRTAEKTGSVGNRGVHLHVRMLLPRHRSRAVTARYA